MIKNSMGVAYDPGPRMNLADGFSPSCEILAYFAERIDPSSLPPIDDTAKSLSPSSATVIVDMDTGMMVEHFSEVDQQVIADTDRQSLILRPSARLATGAHYAVAITRTVRTIDGKVPPSPPGWQAILSGTATEAGAKAQVARMPAIQAALAKVGVAMDQVILAWDFTTASDDSLTRTMRSMQTQTGAMLGKGPLGYTITSVEDNFSLHALRRVRGTFKVPQFISQTNVTVAAATLTLDANGEPMLMGTYDAPFTLILPRAAANGQVKLLIYGHGFLSTAEKELGDASGSYPQDFADAKGYALVGTDWSGLSDYEGLNAAGSMAASLALVDINHLPWITDRLHQALVNAMVLAVTARDGIAKDPALQVNGAQVIDTSRIDYFGISLGGVMGSALMSWSPDLSRGALNVEGAGWTTLAQRSLNWVLFKLVLDGTYPDLLNQQILLEVLQAHFDPVDGMSVAPGLLAMPNKQLLCQMGVNDFQVPNLATEVHARTLGIPLLSDAPLTIKGLSVAKGPVPSALTVWDLHEAAPPPGNVAPPPPPNGNTVHTEVRALPEVMDQIDQFQRTGMVVSTCNGACNFDGGTGDGG
jgi:hypothetical protein